MNSSLLHDFLRADESTQAIIFGSFTLVTIVVTSILAKAWRRVRTHDAETQLKLELLNRGMSAQEIERVVKASSKTAGK